MKSKSVRRILTAILVFAMVAAMLPVGILAADEETANYWDFRLAEYTGQAEYNGLILDGNFNKHGEAYGLQIKNATISVPVSGPSVISVSVGYNWDITFPDGTAYYDATNSGDKVVTYNYSGEAGMLNITVGGQCTSYIKYIEVTPVVTSWDFRLEDFAGQADYNGLKIASNNTVKRHGDQYGMAIKDGTITVPVTGSCVVNVAVGYNWDVTFPDGTQYADDTNPGDITVSYEHTGGAGIVEIKVGANFTSYIKYIELTPIVEPATYWDFRLDEYEGQDSYNGLKMTGKLKKHGAQYGLAVSSSTISVPVPGNCTVNVAVGYNWDITFPDGTQYADKTNSGDITVSYAYTGEKGTVDIAVGSEFTSYIKYIEVIPEAEAVTFWDFRLDAYEGQTSYNGLSIDAHLCKKHSTNYGLQINGGTVSIPVPGACFINVSVGYNWDVTFPDGTAFVDKTDSGDIVVSWTYTGEAGTVDLTLGSEFTSYIKYIELVLIDTSAVPALDTDKVYVWDFGAEQLEGENIVNMLSVEEINSWYAEGTAVGTGANIATFTSSDGLLGFNDGGKSTTHRLRSINEQLIRYDNKSLTDADGNVYTGYIYSNSSSTDTVYVTIKVNAGEKVTLAVGSNGGDSLINFESPTGNVTTGQFLSGSAKIQLLTFYPTESGEYKIYSTTEKLVLARITREAYNEVTVTGAVTEPEGMGEYEIVFTNTLSGMQYTAKAENGAYAVTLLDGYTYDVALLNANGYVITSAASLSIEKPAESAQLDIVIEPVDQVLVTGAIEGLSDEALANLSIRFVADAIYVPEVVIDGSSYTVSAERGVTYQVIIEGINDYYLVSDATVCYTEEATAAITLAAKPTYAITIAPKGAELADLANATFTFTNLNEEGYVYTFTGTEAIALRDGVYSVKVTNSGAFVQQLTSNLKVNGAAVTKTIKFSDDISAWDFSNAEFTGEGGSFQGLTWTNGAKNKTYLLSKEGTISIPVDGDCIIKVSACYEYSFYFASQDEASVGQKTGSTSQIDAFTYNYSGEAGYVTITVLGTSYFTSIEVIKPVEYKETVTVGASGCDYTTINAALEAIRAMVRPNNERVTILIQPGNYEEMLVIDIPNVTLKNASENPSIDLTGCGVDIDENAVRITWYYGHGYTYYSMGSDCKFDADILEVNKENGYASFENPGAGTTSGSYWNSTVVIYADGFRAEGIIFENSFNQYISEAAANDILVKQNGAKEGSVTRSELPMFSTAVQDKAYVERAGALAIANNCKEVYFENCKFIGHQDTLYGGTGVTAAFYECSVYGGTDYIYGGMTAVFAKCDLVFNTSENNNDVGYITAAQTQAGSRGMLMYNCTITSTTPGVDTAAQYTSKPGYFGRPWASNTGEAVFYMTNIEATCTEWYSLGASLIREAGWLATLSGESTLCGEYGTYEIAAGVDNTAARAAWATWFENATLSDGTPITIEAFLGDWNAFEGKDLTIVMSTEKVDNAPKEEPDPSDPVEPTEPEKPAEPVEYHFNSLTDVNTGSTADKGEIAAGTTYADGYFTVVGTVTQRYQESKGGVYAIEIAKNGTGAIEFTVSGIADVTFVVSSTGGSNTSAVAIINAETGEVVFSTEVSTTTATELKVEGLKPGTYQIISPESDYNRGFRLMSIDVIETPADASKTGDATYFVIMALLLSATALVVLTQKKRFF